MIGCGTLCISLPPLPYRKQTTVTSQEAVIILYLPLCRILDESSRTEHRVWGHKPPFEHGKGSFWKNLIVRVC